jgi:hypothetical protein
MKTFIFGIISFGFFHAISAQDVTPDKTNLTVSGYIEGFYTQDFNKPLNNQTPGFLYNFNRTNEVNINLAFIKASYAAKGVRANVALATGTYMNANYSAEPGVLKNIYEANVGIKISKNYNLWVDAGVMPSHIGFESAIGKDNWTLTRSLVAENSPYFEAGAKIGFTTKNEKWYLALLYLNGWQRIQRLNGNSTPAFGTQITFKPASNLTLNYSTFIGNDKPDSTRLMRHYHNVYGVFQLTEKLGLTTGFDIGFEQIKMGSRSYKSWYVPVLIAQLTPTEKVRIAARGEYFADKEGVIINTGTPNGFKTFGCSINVDYLPADHVIWRIEARSLVKGDIPRKQNYFITTSLSLLF